MDNSSLKIQYNRNSYYDYYTGRWLTHDPLGYIDGMNLYEYVRSNPFGYSDPFGLKGECKKGDKQIKIEKIKFPLLQNLRLVTFHGRVILTLVPKIRVWPILPWEEVRDIIVPPELSERAKLITTEKLYHWQLQYASDVTFHLRECECKCYKRIYWTFGIWKRCKVWGWGEPKSMKEKVVTDWLGEGGIVEELSFSYSPSWLEEAIKAYKNQRKATWPSPGVFKSKLSRDYGAEVVPYFTESKVCRRKSWGWW